MAVHSIVTKVSELSVDFDDYTPEARERHEGKSIFVGVHVPIKYAKHLTLSSVIGVDITVDEGRD